MAQIRCAGWKWRDQPSQTRSSPKSPARCHSASPPGRGFCCSSPINAEIIARIRVCPFEIVLEQQLPSTACPQLGNLIGKTFRNFHRLCTGRGRCRFRLGNFAVGLGPVHIPFRQLTEWECEFPIVRSAQDRHGIGRCRNKIRFDRRIPIP